MMKEHLRYRHRRKQLFHCFSCGRGGNVFNFMQELESLSFPESVVRVAELAHIPLDVEIPSSQQAIPQKERKLFEAHEKRVSFTRYVLFNTKGGQEALHYLTDRGYTIDTLKEFGFGFSLKRPHAADTALTRFRANRTRNGSDRSIRRKSNWIL